MNRAAGVGYAVVAYAAFVVASAWAAGFLADRWAPTTIDGRRGGSWWSALAVDLGLLGLFAISHSVMARAGFKRRTARIVPRSVERSTYVLVAGVSLIVLFAGWQALPGTVWRATGALAAAVWVVYALGWTIALTATFMVDHLEFLGLRQAVSGGTAPPPAFTTRLLYGWVRHPMMTGLLIAFWATPHLTVGHLVFALAATGYILVGIRFEERDLRRGLGVAYDDYAARVPTLIPRPARLRHESAAPESR
jgi:protein-S-isoprenylcysteine O-methyltransferase Ste14